MEKEEEEERKWRKGNGGKEMEERKWRKGNGGKEVEEEDVEMG